jgi:DNA polymerase-3 subunit beta
MQEMTLDELLETGDANIEQSFILSVERKQFLSAISLLLGVVEKKNIISILSNIKLSAKDGSLTLTATDMDLSICENIGADIRCEGELTVDCKMLSDIVRKMPDAEVHLKYDSSSAQLIIKGKNCTFNLPTIPADEFPNLELSSSDAVSFEIPSADFLRMLEYTKYSIANESNRYNLNGVCLHKSLYEGADRFAAASTDGHRLSYVSVESPLAVIKLNDILVPRKAVFELIKILKEHSRFDNPVVQVSIGSTKAQFVCNNTVLVSKLIDGIFPDYRIFIPEKTIGILTVNRKLLTEVVDRVSTITSENFRAVEFYVTEKRIEFSAHGNSATKAREILEYSDAEDAKLVYKGADFSRGFNPSYLNDILSVVTSDNVEIHFGYDDRTPTMLKEEGVDSAVFIVMPLSG